MAATLIRCVVPGLPEVVLLRHGETSDSATGLVSGWRDVALTAAGKRQATEIADDLARLGIRQVVSSDLARAVDTARIVAHELGLAPPTLEPRLRERRWGDREGSPKTHKAIPGNDQAPPGGESRAEMERRFLEAIAELPNRTLVVTHAGPLRCLLVRGGVGDTTIAPCDAVLLNESSFRAAPLATYRLAAHVATPGPFAGRVVYVGGPSDLAELDAHTLAILLHCPKAIAIDAMDRAAATINRTRALTAHLTHGRLAPKPYAVAFDWPDGCPRHGEMAILTPVAPPVRRDREPFPDIPPSECPGADELGGKGAGLRLLASLGVSVPEFQILPIRAIEEWCQSGCLLDSAQAWAAGVDLEPSARYAVRSSADVEDREEQPMSGTFESRVDVLVDDLPDAIAEVVASATGPEVLARIAQGDLAAPPKMAVVIQRMVENPLLAGTIFLPAPDDPAEMLVEARCGRGGAELMDGTADADISARIDVAGEIVRLDRHPTVPIEHHDLARIVCRLAAEATRIHTATGRGDLEYAVDSRETIHWLQARVLPAAVEIVDRRGYAPAALAYYRQLAFRVHEANLTEPAYFRCVDLADGRFGYTSGIRLRDRLFHERIARDPEHLVAVTRFGFEVDARFLDMMTTLGCRRPEEVLDELVLHSAVQIPFSMPLAGVHMDRFRSEPVDGHGGPGMIERFLGEVISEGRLPMTVEALLAILRHPPRTSSVVESLRLRRAAFATGDAVDDTTIERLAALDLRDVPSAAELTPGRLRERVLRTIEADRLNGLDLAAFDARLADQTAATRAIAERRGELLAVLCERLHEPMQRQLALWSDYLEMKAETNETHALHRGHCFLWFGRIGYRPEPRARAGFRHD